MSGVINIMKLSLLMVGTWGIGETVEWLLGWPALVGEIGVGMALGPGCLDFIPYVASVSTIGQMGLLLLVLEGGINIELSTLKRIGWKAAAIALSGTALPVLLTWSILPTIPGIESKEALVAGTALSSTAIGMAAKLMSDMGLLKEYLGQLICCAAMIDDVASLVLLAMISNATPQKSDDAVDDDDSSHDDVLVQWGPEGGVVGVMIPLITSISFLAFSWVLATYMPQLIGILTRHYQNNLRLTESNEETESQTENESARRQDHSAGGGAEELSSSVIFQQQQQLGLPAARLPDNLMMLLLFSLATTMTLLASLVRSTPLLGCFMAGVSFASVDGALEAYERSIPPLSAWTSRIFFASIGFAVPVSELFSLRAFGIGLFLTAIAIGSKVVTGVWEYKSKWTVGWAMVGRGELGFVMAEESFRLGLTSELVFAVTVWALLLATLISPLALRQCIVLTNKAKHQAKFTSSSSNEVRLQEVSGAFHKEMELTLESPHTHSSLDV